MGQKRKETKEQRRSRRLRSKLADINRSGRPRLSVRRSNKQIHAQIIDDARGVTLVSASSLEPTLRESVKNAGTVDAADKVGKALAQRATKAGIDKVMFDRGGYLYHGRVKALADGAREGGLNF